jgi:uncharacterized protein
MPEVDVRNNEADARYEIALDGDVVGYAFYRPDRDRVVFTHTEVSPDVGGKGIGSALARGALDDVRRQGKHVVPRCPFIAGYLQRHAEYADLVAGR